MGWANTHPWGRRHGLDRRVARRPSCGEVSGPEIAFVVIAAVMGGAAQSVLGFGAAFTTVPALAVVAPELLPGAALVSFLPLTTVMAVRERSSSDVPAAIRLSLARIPGILVGTVAVRLLDARGLAVTVAVVMLAAVISVLLGWSVPVTPTSESVAGTVSGFFGTAVGLGGPPLAVLYRDRPAQQIRPTLAVVFCTGLALSLLALGVTGSFTRDQAAVGAGLAVAVMAGLIVASPLLRRLPDQVVRAGLLVWAGGGSIVALAQAVFG